MKKLLLLLFTLHSSLFTLHSSLFTLPLSAQHGQYVGGDISLLPSYEASGNVYLDGNGSQISDLLTWLHDECGWNCFRVRLFVNPEKKNQQGESDPAVCQDIEYVKSLGKRIKDAGANFMLDIHYSDTWTDPGSHSTPQAWLDEMALGGITSAEAQVAFLSEKVYTYTCDVLKTLSDSGATPDLIQVGNEVNCGMLWPTGNCYADASSANGTWGAFASYLAAGQKACRDKCPSAKILLHTALTNDGWVSYTLPQTIKDKALSSYTVQDYGLIDYDVIALSYYPDEHGPLSTLESTLKKLKTSFPEKEVQVVETAYCYQYGKSTFPDGSAITWADTPDGQYAFVKDLMASLGKYDNVKGLSYWFPEESGTGDGEKVINSWMNRGLWWPENNNGHWPVKASEGMVSYLMKSFLSTDGINSLTPNPSPLAPHPSSLYNLSGQKVSNTSKGILIRQGRKEVF